jgi:hypothetical protein
VRSCTAHERIDRSARDRKSASPSASVVAVTVRSHRCIRAHAPSEQVRAAPLCACASRIVPFAVVFVAHTATSTATRPRAQSVRRRPRLHGLARIWWCRAPVRVARCIIRCSTVHSTMGVSSFDAMRCRHVYGAETREGRFATPTGRIGRSSSAPSQGTEFPHSIDTRNRRRRATTSTRRTRTSSQRVSNVNNQAENTH